MERVPNYRLAKPEPDHIMLSINGDPRYTMTVTWRTSADVENGYLEFYERGGEKFRADAVTKVFKSDINASNIHFAKAENL